MTTCRARNPRRCWPRVSSSEKGQRQIERESVSEPGNKESGNKCALSRGRIARYTCLLVGGGIRTRISSEERWPRRRLVTLGYVARKDVSFYVSHLDSLFFSFFFLKIPFTVLLPLIIIRVESYIYICITLRCVIDRISGLFYNLRFYPLALENVRGSAEKKRKRKMVKYTRKPRMNADF